MADQALKDAVVTGFELDVPDHIIHDRQSNSAATMNGLSDWQRWVVKNVFDTQPKRRRSYLKRLGYEMHKDGEQYRPLNSDTKYREIEPTNVVLGFIPFWNLFTEEGRDELQRDLKDIDIDVGVEGPAVGAGTLAGAAAGFKGGGVAGATIGGTLGAAGGPPGIAAGATAGGGIGASIGTISGAALGGAAAKATVETIKAGIGEFFLDEDVPLDLQELTYQSLVAGGFSAFGKAGSNIIKNWQKMKAKDVQNILKEAGVRKSNGTFNMTLADDLAENPQNYTPEKVKGANLRLLEFVDGIFGTSVENPRSTKQLKGGVAKDAINPLNKQADLEIERLSHEKAANFQVDEILETLKDRLSGVAKKTFRTQEEERAFKFFNLKMKELKKKTKIGGGPTGLFDTQGREIVQPEVFRELNFKEGREFLKTIQNAAWEEGFVKDNNAVKSMAHGLKELADIKAGILKSPLPQINQKRSEILVTYKNIQSLLKDGTVQNAFVGKDSVAKQRVQRALVNADRVLDTKLAEGMETLQFQAAVEKLYQSPAAFGSGSVLGDAMKQGLREAPKEAFRGGTLGSMSALVSPESATKIIPASAAIFGARGFAKGFKEGATFSSPETLVKGLSKVQSRLDDLNNVPSIRESAQKGILSVGGQVEAQFDNLTNPEVQSPQPQLAPPAPAPTPPPTDSPGAEPQAPAPGEGGILSQDLKDEFSDFRLDL